jgi:hypothetical protein
VATLRDVMTKMPTSPPANITEFNVIVGLLFAQLYNSFPKPIGRLNELVIARAMGVSTDSILGSGKRFDDVLRHSVRWLSDEGYIRLSGLTAYDDVTLTQKGLALLNAVPEGLSATVGSSLVKATSETSGQSFTGICDLIGGVIGGLCR